MVSLLNWRVKTLDCAELKKNNDVRHFAKKGFSQFFIPKIFLANTFSKTVEHVPKDTEFFEEFRSIFEILAELFYKNIFHHCLDRRS